jgi:cytoskeletal protein CcmA (bactofilin family)
MSNPYDTVGEGSSVLGPTIRFIGELSAGEDLVVHGQVNGSIAQGTRVTVGPKGFVTADIHSVHIDVEGRVEGNLMATKSVTVHETASLRGNITAPAVSIQPGAVFSGMIDMDAARPGARASAGPDNDPNHLRFNAARNS